MDGRTPSEKDSKGPDDKPNPSIITKQAGVWQFATIEQPSFDPQRRWNEVVSGLQLFRRLGTEISSVSRTLLILFVLSKLWEGIESAILMHLSSSLLQILEVGIRDGQPDTFAILVAIISRLSCAAFVAILDWWTGNHHSIFKSRVVQYYEAYLMRDPDSQMHISPTDAWIAFDAIVAFFGEILTSASQLTLIIHVSRTSGGPVFAFLCVARPLLKVLFTEDVWSKMWVVNLHHKDYQRMQSLAVLTGDMYRQDYITGNLTSHIMEEYEKARENLGDTCTDEFWQQIEKKSSPLFEVISSMASDLPMQSSSSLRYSLQTIIRETQSFQRHISKLKNLYAVSEKTSRIKTGDVPYPSAKSPADGMALELKDVVFEYPGSKNKSPALKTISLNFKPGQLVVIVGANGSGKSTIIKLLTRLYNPTSGTLIIDGTPAQDYRSFDLRHTMASFTQDHNLYPLSLYENISFGNVARSGDVAAVAAAAKQGGAADFIAKLVDGMDTNLKSRLNVRNINVPDEPDHPLRKRLHTLNKDIDISGGEKQRLVASRTFMHLNSGHVRFVAVDEPSSALDPEAELQIFNSLIASRAGKTMVFVTHRFGHLTKHADQIICMKDGSVEESGSHDELMKLAGEYAKLYQIQADAFSDSA
ncbi:hypothetical protein DXG01_016514 [Tephrocybe rancida]|nr:hypothetical protein DXG01_016514 [Tephrocybe rancida]